MKTKIIPFDLETAKKIQAGEIEGKLWCSYANEYKPARIICWDRIPSYPIVVLVKIGPVYESVLFFSLKGESQDNNMLFIELPEEAPEEQCPIEESELYQAGYKVGFEAGRCVAFDEKKGRAIKEEAPKQLTLADCKCGELVFIRDKFEKSGFLKVKKEGEQCDGRCHKPMVAASTSNSNLLYSPDTPCWNEIPLEEEPNIIDSKSLYEKWKDIQNALNELFRKEAAKNSADFSDDVLVHYAAELFTWFRETHLIFKFRWDKLNELNQFAEEHIMEPSWSYEARRNIKKIFGLETPKQDSFSKKLRDTAEILATPKPQFKPFDKVLVTQNGWHYWIPSLYRNETPDGKHICIDDLEYDCCIPYEGNEHLAGTNDEPKE